MKKLLMTAIIVVMTTPAYAGSDTGRAAGFDSPGFREGTPCNCDFRPMPRPAGITPSGSGQVVVVTHPVTGGRYATFVPNGTGGTATPRPSNPTVANMGNWARANGLEIKSNIRNSSGNVVAVTVQRPNGQVVGTFSVQSSTKTNPGRRK